MKKSFFATTSLFALFVSFNAAAADLPRKSVQPVFATPAFSWTGAYVGVDAGYLTSSINATIPGLPGFVSSTSPAGFTYGAHIGYRYQFQNSFVLGLEARGFAIANTRKEVLTIFPPTVLREELTRGGDLRLSYGYSFGKTLVYATGGLAIIGGRGCFAFAAGAPCAVGGSVSDSSRIGWTVGAGAAYALTNNWIARLDYSYSNFGSKNYTTPIAPGGITRVKLDTNAIRLGISYKF